MRQVPPSGQITILEDNELRAFHPSGGKAQCLVYVGRRAATNHARPVWNAAADAALLGNRALFGPDAVTPPLTARREGVPQWSRPSGSSVIYLSEDRLLKRPSGGGKAIDISFLERHDSASYHPAGEHILTSGLDERGRYGLYLSANLGTEPRALVRDGALSITDPYFSEDGRYLYFSAQHRSKDRHLHRFRMDEGAPLETIETDGSNFDFAVSPFRSRLVAWYTEGDCAGGENGSFATRGVTLRTSSDIDQMNVRPVGWLPDGDLVVLASTTGCSTAQPGDVYVLSEDDAPVLIHEESYGSVSVRVKMPPPPPPPEKEQEVAA